MVEQNLLFEVLFSSWFFSSLEIHPSCSLGTVFLMKTYLPLITWEVKRERCEHKPGVFAGAAGGCLHAGRAGLWVTASPALGVVTLPGGVLPPQGSPGRLPYLPALYTPVLRLPRHTGHKSPATSASQARIHSCLSVQHLGEADAVVTLLPSSEFRPADD